MPSSNILKEISFLHLLNQVCCQADKVWHIGILFKLQAYGADGENYLENRKQRFVLNVQTSE